jgi:hypothetical protein
MIRSNSTAPSDRLAHPNPSSATSEERSPARSSPERIQRAGLPPFSPAVSLAYRRIGFAVMGLFAMLSARALYEVAAALLR